MLDAAGGDGDRDASLGDSGWRCFLCGESGGECRGVELLACSDRSGEFGGELARIAAGMAGDLDVEWSGILD